MHNTYADSCRDWHSRDLICSRSEQKNIYIIHFHAQHTLAISHLQQRPSLNLYCTVFFQNLLPLNCCMVVAFSLGLQLPLGSIFFSVPQPSPQGLHKPQPYMAITEVFSRHKNEYLFIVFKNHRDDRLQRRQKLDTCYYRHFRSR